MMGFEKDQLLIDCSGKINRFADWKNVLDSTSSSSYVRPEK